MKVSGGLDGGSDPPAFQRAEKERLAKLSVEENAKQDISIFLVVFDNSRANLAALLQVDLKNLKIVVDGYLHNEEEKRFKKIIWEEINREYLE
ncbi:hypothetical protein Golax_001314, partial [Gossypium laxum]|nr:hypothetical protein [Gossypium laxum]